jgi:predicted membrane-bound dolichyl-phosphate-mannose-protein mannosyltransferase
MLTFPPVKQGPLEYLIPGVPFNAHNFPDTYWPIMTVALVGLIVTVVLYNVRVRQLHRFEVLRNLQEWLLWTGLIFFGLLLVEGVFSFYFLFVLATIIIGCSVFVWIRFFRFPPLIAGYNEQLRRQRSYGQVRKSAEATIRRRGRTQRRR